MIINKFHGLNVDDDNRNSFELELAVNVAIDDGEMSSQKGNVKLNTTAYAGAVMGLFHYRPPGAVSGIVLVCDDGTVQS
jgi:hypothetical protein